MLFRELFELPKPYLFFALLRVILTCLPQIGYIHPDEYFQSIEVIAEKSLNVRVAKPWEFNVTQPIRTVAPIYFTVGLSYQLLKLANLCLNGTLTTPYFILVFPRIIFCLLSFLTDWSLYRICSANSEKSKSRCLILSTSYVMIVYATRTFSNTIELILFSLLLYYVAESLIFSNINIRQREYINKRYQAAETVVERAKFHKLRLYLENDSLRSYFIIATITTAGFFNRPTFAAYAIPPVFFWLYRGIGFKSIATIQFHVRTFMFLISTVPTVLFFVVVDSFYFGYLTWGEIGVLAVSINNFVVTPWNFVKYNINPTNLAQHGLHPHYVHALVNIPLLFGVLALTFYSNIADLCTSLTRSKYHYLPSVRSIRGLMTASILFPLALLSIFPHQEPRFLIPIVLPMMYLYAPAILPEDVHTVAKSASTRPNPAKKVHKSYSLFKLWLGFNALCVLFYGFVHQAGVYRFVSDLSNQIRTTDNNLNYEVVTSHIYSVPHSLFYQRDESGFGSYRRMKRVTLYEKGSVRIDEMLKTIRDLLKARTEVVSNFNYKLYLVIPESLVDDLMHYLSDGANSDLIAGGVVTYYPHLSTEAFPVVDYRDFFVEPSWTFLKFVRAFGLTRIEFILNAA
ncbi:hypothetical protein RN001_010764 [Aquatica leii]|uniref:Mannosyltransferase n=1 Tax=Aquatica leii TaxID=1421715 RepID=A0AAN7P896_9COLE|nr:hypothetical protein RN001_010764 [Aquatica leii]